jgi:N-acetylglucosamine-6-phosphate deacetylase
MIIITQGTIYTESATLINGYLKIVGGKITETGPMAALDTTEGFYEISIPKGYRVIPGMIDLHIHGGNHQLFGNHSHTVSAKNRSSPYLCKGLYLSSFDPWASGMFRYSFGRPFYFYEKKRRTTGRIYHST